LADVAFVHQTKDVTEEEKEINVAGKNNAKQNGKN